MAIFPAWFKPALPGQTLGGTVQTAALLLGSGTSSTPTDGSTTADKNFLGFWLKSSATTGDIRGLYLRLYLYGAAGGEAIRGYATANAANVATGGTVNGAHLSLSIPESCSVSGAGNALRATLGASAQSRTLSGTLAAIQVDSDIGADNTVPATAAFIRVTDTGSVKIGRLLNIPAASNSTIFATHTTQAMTHSIRITDAAGTPYYIMCASAATNRGGGS
jgi:hypothetical protein